jgi:hypothetical protein
MQSDQKTQFSSSIKRFLLNGNFQIFLMFKVFISSYSEKQWKNWFYGLIRTLLSGYHLPYSKRNIIKAKISWKTWKDNYYFHSLKLTAYYGKSHTIEKEPNKRKWAKNADPCSTGFSNCTSGKLFQKLNFTEVGIFF